MSIDRGGPVSQNLRNYTKALDGFDAVIQPVPTDRWDADSPCEGWSARDVVAHACGVMHAVEAMARTVDVPEHAPAMDRFLGLTGRNPNR